MNSEKRYTDEFKIEAVKQVNERTWQYLSIRYNDKLAEAGVDASVRSVGDSYDNALAETINGLYKTEVIRHPGRGHGKQ